MPPMPRRSPFADLHEAHARAENERRAGAVQAAGREGRPGAAIASSRAVVEWIPFAPEGADPAEACRIVAGFGAIEAEYAAIRRAAGLMDSCQRGTLRVVGADRIDFLQRMLTQDLAPLRGGGNRESFWLNRKGRIDADMLVVDTGDETLIDVDVFAAAPTREALDRFLFTESATIEDATESISRLSLHGPEAPAALDAAGLGAAASLQPGGALSILTPGGRCVVARRDQCDAPGFELFVPGPHALALWAALASRARPVGWEAFNLARIEGGTPLFRIDFGVESLPHETGVLASRVSFRKGCYLGQEIVARMESLGAPKQQVVAFRASPGALPVAGAQLRRPDEPMATPIGMVTSSSLSPMLGGIGVGFATVRSAVAERGRRLAVHAEGEVLELEVLGPPASFIRSGTA